MLEEENKRLKAQANEWQDAAEDAVNKLKDYERGIDHIKHGIRNAYVNALSKVMTNERSVAHMYGLVIERIHEQQRIRHSAERADGFGALRLYRNLVKLQIEIDYLLVFAIRVKQAGWNLAFEQAINNSARRQKYAYDDRNEERFVTETERDSTFQWEVERQMIESLRHYAGHTSGECEKMLKDEFLAMSKYDPTAQEFAERFMR
jgi:hypothetical protein